MVLLHTGVHAGTAHRCDRVHRLAILPRLLEHGHEVTAVVRTEEKAESVRAAGADAQVTDLGDRARMVALLRDSEGVVHTAAPGDATSAAFDRGVADAVIEAYTGSGKPYVHTGGCWVYGSGTRIEETDPHSPPALTDWRPGVQEVLEAADLALTVLHPGIVYGGGGGLTGVVAGAPRTEDGRLTTVGSGEQHWVTIHVDDLAALYVAVLDAGSGFDAVLGVNGEDVRVADLTAAIAGAARIATESPDATRARLGDALAEALLLDQIASGGKARAIGGWRPTRPGFARVLAEESGAA